MISASKMWSVAKLTSTSLIRLVLWNITFVSVEDRKRSPEAQHNVNFEMMIEDDAEDEENCHTTQHWSNGNHDVWLCGDKNHSYSYTLGGADTVWALRSWTWCELTLHVWTSCSARAKLQFLHSICRAWSMLTLNVTSKLFGPLSLTVKFDWNSLLRDTLHTISSLWHVGHVIVGLHRNTRVAWIVGKSDHGTADIDSRPNRWMFVQLLRQGHTHTHPTHTHTHCTSEDIGWNQSGTTKWG